MEAAESKSPAQSASRLVLAADIGATVRLAAFVEIDGALRLVAIGEGPSTHAAPHFDPSVGFAQARNELRSKLGVYAGGDLPSPQALTGPALGCGVPAAIVGNLPSDAQAQLEGLLRAQGFTLPLRIASPKRKLADKFSPEDMASELLAAQAPLVVIALAGDQGWESLAVAADVLRFGVLGRIPGYRPAVALLLTETPEAGIVAELNSEFSVYQSGIKGSHGGIDLTAARSTLAAAYQALLIGGAASRQPLGMEGAAAVPVDAAIGNAARAIAVQGGISVAVLHAEHSGAAVAISDGGDTRVGAFGFRNDANAVDHVGLQLSIDDVLQWVPAAISRADAVAHFTNRAWRPWLVPETQTELLLDHAAAHLALREAVRALGEPSPPVDLVVCTGRALSAAPRPVQAALCSINAYLPSGYCQIALDRTGALAMFGALGAAGHPISPETALVHVTTCLACNGVEKLGAQALALELTPDGGEAVSRQIAFGAMDRIMWHSSAPATIRAWPAGKLDVGGGKGRATALRMKVRPGTAGVIIDARGRPIDWPKEPGRRRAAVLQWLQSTDSYLLPSPELDGTAVDL